MKEVPKQPEADQTAPDDASPGDGDIEQQREELNAEAEQETVAEVEKQAEFDEAIDPAAVEADLAEPDGPAGTGEMVDASGRLAELPRKVEALLLASDEPLTPSKLAVLTGAGRRDVRAAVEALNAAYDRTGHSFRVEQIAEGYQMLTQGAFNDLLEQLLAVRKDSKLSQAALETLAVVAYKQPVTRADIEVIRGVACGDVLRSLMEKRLAKIVGRAEILGRPMLYGTTRRFLEVFGLRALGDLPQAEALKDPDKNKPAGAAKAESADQAQPDKPIETEQQDG